MRCKWDDCRLFSWLCKWDPHTIKVLITSSGVLFLLVIGLAASLFLFHRFKHDTLASCPRVVHVPLHEVRAGVEIAAKLHKRFSLRLLCTSWLGEALMSFFLAPTILVYSVPAPKEGDQDKVKSIVGFTRKVLGESFAIVIVSAGQASDPVMCLPPEPNKYGVTTETLREKLNQAAQKISTQLVAQT